MHESVKKAFTGFAEQFDGRVSWMYLNIFGLVTTAVGISIDPLELAIELPFVRKEDGTRASTREIRAEWSMIKAESTLVSLGYWACQERTRLRLEDEDIDNLVLNRVLANERMLRRTFPAWEDWPADAQLGVLSMAWVLGPEFTKTWRDFTLACLSGDWADAARKCAMREWGDTCVKSRNRVNAELFGHAAAVTAACLDSTVLLYQHDLRAPRAAFKS